MFFLRKKTKNTPHMTLNGFTLVETLVAISILLMAVVAPLVIIAGNISAIFSVKDKVTALYLAEDGIDYIKYKIDTNYNKIDAGIPVNWLEGIPCINENDWCEIDSFNDTIGLCNRDTYTCVPLKLNSGTGVYGYVSGSNSKFTRTVRIKEEGGNPDDQVIKAEVTWQDHGVPKQVIVAEHTFHWR